LTTTAEAGTRAAHCQASVRGYLRGVHRPDRLPSPLTLLRVGLAVFVLAWIFGPYALRAAVPIWLPFLIALGLELHFSVGARRPARAGRPDRGPRAADRERYGYGTDAEELVLVREGGEELWIPYSGETGEELSALIYSFGAGTDFKGWNAGFWTSEDRASRRSRASIARGDPGHQRSPREVRDRLPGRRL
jgi:hypothetical protein